MTHSYLIYLEKSLPRCPPCLPLSSAQGDLHKRHLLLSYCLEKRWKKKRHAKIQWEKRPSTSMGHISLRACAKIVQNNRKRSLTHPLSMLSAWWFFQLKIPIEFWYTKKAIWTLISRFKIILLRSFASNLNLTWGENSWKHSFTFGTLGTHLRSPLNGDMQLIRPQPWTKKYERVCLR